MRSNRSITSKGDLLRVSEAADLLGLKPATIRSWILKRKLGYVRLSARAIRLRRADVEGIIDQRFVPAAEGPGLAAAQ
jgi:excisionase family DNA binding protein